MKLRPFLSELRRRKVTRVAVAYAIVGIGVAEAGQLLFEALELPMTGWQILVVLILLGFPIALLLAWALELTPEGVRRTVPGAARSTTRGAAPAPSGGSRANWASIAGWALAAILLGWTAWQAFSPDDTGSTIVAAVSSVSAVDAAADRGDWIEAYDLAMALPAGIPDSTRSALLEEISSLREIRSEPSGAAVVWRPAGHPEIEWRPVGTTPIDWRGPRVPVHLRYELDGYAPFITVDASVRLRSLSEALPWTIEMPGRRLDLTLADSRVAHAPAVDVGGYLMDRYEVTNREFREFVDSGGYERRDLWNHAFERDGREVSWDEAMAAFVDQTGRPGPSRWSGGTYPERMEDYPVTGISWYEAAAYADYAGRSLPTLYHWEAVARSLRAEFVTPLSNLERDGPAPVGQFEGLTLSGASDMAGNAREWLANAMGDLRYTAGGGWSDPAYMFGLYQPQPPFDRSETNGVRLMTNLGDPAGYEAASRPVDFVARDFYSETPVSDDVFAAFAELYEYDDLPLNVEVEAVDTIAVGIRERITFDAGYDSDRMILYLVRPLEADGPLQTVLYFPGSGALRTTNPAAGSVAASSRVSYLVRSGRAVVWPVLDGTYERADDYVYRLQDPSNEHRDHVLHWRQDVGRSLDYLQTRADIDANRFAYMGSSWGGRMGAIMLAVEPRFRAAVLVVPGLSQLPTQPVAEPFNFVSRVTLPVLMLNGEHDNIYPLETAARPFYDFLGTPPEQKVHFIAPGGHSVPDLDETRETLNWLDRYLGEVR